MWIMDDGSRVGGGLKLCTHRFTYNECLYLKSLLVTKFNLVVTVQSAGAKNQYNLYIHKGSVPLLYSITKEF